MIIKTEKFAQLSYNKDGQGPAIVLVHGFPENKDLWQEVVPLLAVSFTVISIDIPGAGESTLPSEVSMDSLAESINDVLRAEDLEEVVVVGHSMGGYISLAFAEKFPYKVAGLSLVHSVATADSEEKKENRKKSVALIRKGGKEAFIKQMIPNLFSPEFRKMHPSVIEEHVKSGMELEAESMIAFTEAMMTRPDRTEVLENAAFPVQIVLGEDDALIPLKTALTQSKLANRNFVSMYEHVGHMSMIEHAEVLGLDIRGFAGYCYTNRSIEQRA